MSSVYCSQEQIEQKRKLALQRLKEKQQNGTASHNIIAGTSSSFIKPSLPFQQYQNKKHVPVMKSNSPLRRYSPIKTNQFFGKKSESIIVTCRMISRIRFTVDLAKYEEPIIAVLKTIPSRLYGRQI